MVPARQDARPEVTRISASPASKLTISHVGRDPIKDRRNTRRHQLFATEGSFGARHQWDMFFSEA